VNQNIIYSDITVSKKFERVKCKVTHDIYENMKFKTKVEAIYKHCFWLVVTVLYFIVNSFILLSLRFILL